MKQAYQTWFIAGLVVLAPLLSRAETVAPPPAETKEGYVLAPAPREITYHQGDCRLAPGSHVWVDLSGTADLLPVAEQVRDALGGLYGGLQLSAADGTNTSVEIRILPDRVSRAQGYELVILPDKVRVTAHDTVGAFYAAQTLKQMCRVVKGRLRCLKISDWPDFPNCGVMLDISRDKVPTMETLYQLVDMLAEFKVNQFQLYTQHTFAYGVGSDPIGTLGSTLTFALNGYGDNNVVIGDLSTVPEPATIIVWSLLGTMAIGFGWWRLRKA